MKKLYGYKINSEDIVLIPENEFEIDGYQVADRLLESVIFKIVVTENDLTIEPSKKSDKDYFEQFNKEHWLKKIKELAIRQIKNDIVTIPKYLQKKYKVAEDGFFK